MFDSEGALVDKFLTCLRTVSPWGKVMAGVEFFYQRGRTDVVAVDDDGRVIAFEAKLLKWREALQQAYRNTCFAHRSYVVLPRHTAMLAHRYSAEFALRGIGICYIWQEGVIVLQEADEKDPLQPWLSRQAISWVTDSEGVTYKADLFIAPDGSMYTFVQTNPPELVASGFTLRGTAKRVGD